MDDTLEPQGIHWTVPASWRHRVRRLGMQAAVSLWPEASTRVLARRYLTPSGCFTADLDRYQARDFDLVTAGPQTLLRFGNAPGPDEGKRLLIVPGHDGHFRQFLRLARQLRATGAGVDLLVLPGHLGPHPTPCGMNAIVDALCDIGQRCGPYDGLVAHCVGCNGSLFAMEQVALARKLVFLSAPLALANLVRFAGRQYGLQGRGLERFMAQVSHLGAPYLIDRPWQPIAAHRTEPLLVIHARNDYAVPVTDVSVIEPAWPGARLILLDHGDHNTILGQRNAIDPITAFLCAAT